MSEELKKKIENILLQPDDIFLEKNWEKVISKLLALVEREKQKAKE